VLTNIDELFEREELSAAPDVGWPDCFNSGVFVFRPSDDTYASLLQFALTTGSFDGAQATHISLCYSALATTTAISSENKIGLYSMYTSGLTQIRANSQWT